MNRNLISTIVFCAVMTVAALSQGQTTRRSSAPPPPEPATTAAQAKLPPLSILSIIPAQGEPGMTVTVNGTGFTPTTVAFLGSSSLLTTVLTEGRILSFEIPDLAAGAYALYLKRGDGSTSRAFNFNVLPQRPVATALSPDTVPACSSGRDREVVISGANFQTGSRVLFDGAAIGTRFISPGALAFQVPQLPGGLHQVQVKNPSDAVSGAVGLMIDAKPEILNVAIGPDHVVYYDLIITGRNFQQNSFVVADGNRIGTAQPAVGDRDQSVYLGCNQIIYQRHQYDPTPKEIRLQVINPTGEESSLLTISAP